MDVLDGGAGAGHEFLGRDLFVVPVVDGEEADEGGDQEVDGSGAGPVVSGVAGVAGLLAVVGQAAEVFGERFRGVLVFRCSCDLLGVFRPPATDA